MTSPKYMASPKKEGLTTLNQAEIHSTCCFGKAFCIKFGNHSVALSLQYHHYLPVLIRSNSYSLTLDHRVFCCKHVYLYMKNHCQLSSDSDKHPCMFGMPTRLVVKCSTTDSYIIFTTLFYLFFLMNF